MKHFLIKGFSAAILTSALLAAPAFADDVHILSAKLTGVQLLATQAEQIVVHFDGKGVPASLTQRLAVIESSLIDARALASGTLGRDIGNVLNQVTALKQEKVISDATLSIVQEVAIEAKALRVNAILMQAGVNLDKASRAKDSDVAHLLESAKAHLLEAEVQGGYHVGSDVATINAALVSLSGGTLDRGLISDLVTEVNGRLYQFGVTS